MVRSGEASRNCLPRAEGAVREGGFIGAQKSGPARSQSQGQPGARAEEGDSQGAGTVREGLFGGSGRLIEGATGKDLTGTEKWEKYPSLSPFTLQSSAIAFSWPNSARSLRTKEPGRGRGRGGGEGTMGVSTDRR